MPRPRALVPSYTKHAASGQARATINGRDFYLGPHGSAESKRAYDRLITEYIASGRSSSFGTDSATITVAMLMVDYLAHAKSYYGVGATSEWHRIKLAIKPLNELHAELPAVDFGPQQFKAARERMIANGLTRSGINAHMKRIVRMFKWAASEGMLPPVVYDTLRLIPGLRKGRTNAKESKPVQPISLSAVEATIKHLTPVVADMVRVQLLLGCRPGEVCKLTPGMIDRSGEVWIATLGDHKTAHHGHARTLYIGPQGQQVISRYLDRGEHDCLFRPMDSAAARRARDLKNRTTPLNCGNRPGKSNRPKTKDKTRVPGDRYTVPVYARAIKRAAEKAGVEHWSPNRLRHTRATEIRKQFGLEAAQVILGHSAADVTQVYAERDAAKAIEVARQVG